MSLLPDDRKSFSLKIASADQEIGVYIQAKAQLAAEVAKLQRIDDANKNLFDPTNLITNMYQTEYTALDGITRFSFGEVNIQDSAAVKIGNYFYPNNVQIPVPSLAATNNVWTKPKPFAITYAIGKNYTEGQPVVTKEGDLVAAVQSAVTALSSFSAIEKATGLKLEFAGTCSLPQFTTESTCVAGGGTWDAQSGIATLVTNTALVNAKNTLVSAVNALKTFLQTEVTSIVTTDKNVTIQGQNNAAINNINAIIIPALNTWLAYVDFNSTGVTSSNFNTFDATTLAPTKLSAAMLTALSNSLTARLSYITTRLSQLSVTVGTISQDLNTGAVTSSGIYGKRYSLLLLRLDILNGSLSKLLSMKNASGAQDAIIESIKTNKATYLTVVPTSLLTAPGNDTATIQIADDGMFSIGDSVYIMAEGQEELQRAIKSVNGKVIVLNDIVPAKYKTANKLRIYKDLT